MTRLFSHPAAELADEARSFADEPPRLKHWCNDPTCSRCDEIAETQPAPEAERCPQCDGTGELEDEGAMFECWYCLGDGVRP